MKDEIIEQVRRVKETMAAKYKYDVRALAKDLQKKEQASGGNYVNIHDARFECVHG